MWVTTPHVRGASPTTWIQHPHVGANVAELCRYIIPLLTGGRPAKNIYRHAEIFSKNAPLPPLYRGREKKM